MLLSIHLNSLSLLPVQGVQAGSEWFRVLGQHACDWKILGLNLLVDRMISLLDLQPRSLIPNYSTWGLVDSNAERDHSGPKNRTLDQDFISANQLNTQ